jgi:TolB-like protein
VTGRTAARALSLAALGVLASWRLAPAQCPDGTPPPCGRAPAASPSANSVAVLSFRNVTRDSAFAYLSEGLSSEIATSLSGVPRLEVRSPGVVRSVEGNGEPDPRAIGRRLNVRYVVEGEYQRGGDRIRIAVRLVTVAGGTQRWSDAWTRPTTDLLAVQEEIARQVATSIAGELLPGERSAMASGTSDPEAYDRFLRGNFALRRRELGEAIGEYGAALALDTAFVRARARVAYSYGLLLDRNETMDGLPPESLLARGMRAADRALADDARSSDAWMARGILAEAQDPLTLAGSREAFERAVALDPRNAEAWHQYGSALAYLGRDSAAFAAWDRVLALDPDRPQTVAEVARLDVYGRRFDEGARLCRGSALRSGAFVGDECVQALAAVGDTAGALAMLDSMDRTHGHLHLDLRAGLAGRLLSASDPWVRARLADTPQTCVQTVHDRGLLWLAVGQPDSGLAALENCAPLGPRVWFFLRDPAWDPVRETPRFRRLWNRTRPPGAEVR